MNNQLIFQAGFECLCSQFGLNSVKVFTALSDIHQAGLELNNFNRFAKNLITYEGLTPYELEIEDLAQLYLFAKVVCELPELDPTPIGKNCLSLQSFEQISFDDEIQSQNLPDKVNNLNSLPTLLELITGKVFKIFLLETIKKTQFDKRSILMHWFYYKLTQELVENETAGVVS